MSDRFARFSDLDDELWIELREFESALAMRRYWPVAARRALEHALALVVREEMLAPLAPEAQAESSLHELCSHPAVKTRAGREGVEALHFFRRLGNAAAHGTVVPEEGHGPIALELMDDLLRLVWPDLAPPERDDLVAPPSARVTAAPVRPRRRITPSLDELEARTGEERLTLGHVALLRFLDAELPDDWSLYVEPYVRGLRPDVVVWHPTRGAVLFEVKDWNPRNYERREDGLHGRDSMGNAWREEVEPAAQINRVLTVVREGPLADQLGSNGDAKDIVHGVLYVHTARRGTIEIFRNPDLPQIACLCADDLRRDLLKEFVRYPFESPRLDQSQKWRESLERFRTELDPPVFVGERGRPIESDLSPRQRDLARTRWDVSTKRHPDAPTFTDIQETPARSASPASRAHARRPSPEGEPIYRRMRGPAGSGKSLVLALRAGRAARRGKRVLIVSYHITMVNYLHDLVRRSAGDAWGTVRIRHYHGLGRDIETDCDPRSVGKAKRKPVRRTRLDAETRQAPDLLRILREGGERFARWRGAFDAIYVDEAQDFPSDWLDALALLLAQGGELVIVADRRQDLHGAGSSPAKLEICRFNNRWATLPAISYRIPDRLAVYLNDYARRREIGDPDDAPLIPKGLPGLEGCMEWWNAATFEALLDALPSVRERLASTSHPHPNDTVFLCQNRKIGKRVLGRLIDREGQGRIMHTFGDDLEEERIAASLAREGLDEREAHRMAAHQVQRPQKLAFFMGAGKLKATTIHSFKGWELANVVLVWTGDRSHDHEEEIQSRETLYYTALSRARHNVFVLNCDPAYVAEGTAWDAMELV